MARKGLIHRKTKQPTNQPTNQQTITTPGQNGPRSNANEDVLYIPQSSRTGSSPLDRLVSYQDTRWSGVIPHWRCSRSISRLLNWNSSLKPYCLQINYLIMNCLK